MHTQHSPKLFTRNLVVWFLNVDKACEDVFSILPRFSKFCWRVKCGLYCYSWDENLAGCHSGLIQLFCGALFQGTWQRKCRLFENFPKSIVGRTKCPRGPRDCDPGNFVQQCTSLSNLFYLLISLYCMVFMIMVHFFHTIKCLHDDFLI